MNYFTIHQKLTQRCMSTILQFKKNPRKHKISIKCWGKKSSKSFQIKCAFLCLKYLVFKFFIQEEIENK